MTTENQRSEEATFQAGDIKLTTGVGWPYWTTLEFGGYPQGTIRFHHRDLDNLEYLIKKAKHHLREICNCKELLP